MTGEDLRTLIANSKGTRSYDQMSRDCAGNPTSKRLQQIAGGTVELKAFPDPVTIEGLARGTGATVTAVVMAAARSVGLQVHDGMDPQAIVIGDAAGFTDGQRDALHQFARSIRESNSTSKRDALESIFGSVYEAAEPLTEDYLTAADWPPQARQSLANAVEREASLLRNTLASAGEDSSPRMRGVSAVMLQVLEEIVRNLRDPEWTGDETVEAIKRRREYELARQVGEVQVSADAIAQAAAGEGSQDPDDGHD